MARYFFDTADGDHDIDRDGVACADDAAARDAAIRYAGSLIHDQPALLAPDHALRVRTRDAAGRVIFTVTITVA
jgi:hypothetical protein